MAKAVAVRVSKTDGPHLRLERDCPAPVCGVDEAGRGPWAGPVSAGAVILSTRRRIAGLDDSKRLTAAQREALEPEIKARAIAWGVGFATVEEIGTLNILQATGLAMRRAVMALATTPAFALVDGNYAFDLPCPVRVVVGGDALSASIAAASILAKVARDRVMHELDRVHPGYGFASHKGYGVPEHAQALTRLGPCPIHRMTWARCGRRLRESRRRSRSRKQSSEPLSSPAGGGGPRRGGGGAAAVISQASPGQPPPGPRLRGGRTPPSGGREEMG